MNRFSKWMGYIFGGLIGFGIFIFIGFEPIFLDDSLDQFSGRNFAKQVLYYFFGIAAVFLVGLLLYKKIK